MWSAKRESEQAGGECGRRERDEQLQREEGNAKAAEICGNGGRNTLGAVLRMAGKSVEGRGQ
jgi:hypothetical protein